MTEVLINVEATLYIIGAILGILTPPGILIGRAFWSKHKFFQQQTKTLEAQQTRIESLEKHDYASGDTHDGFEKRLKTLEDDAIEIKLYLKLLLDNAKIKHD